MDKLDYLYNQSRKNNILIDGIPDMQDEMWSDSERKVRSMFFETFGLDAENIETEQAHRIGQYNDGQRPRQ